MGGGGGGELEGWGLEVPTPPPPPPLKVAQSVLKHALVLEFLKSGEFLFA